MRCCVFFFFSSRRRHTRCSRDWSSDVCSSDLAEAIAIARRSGFEAGLNDPFAGGHVIERHARPSSGVHALQVEIDRRCYLDARLAKPGAGFDRVAAVIETLAVELGEELIGRRYATAAE